MSEELQRRVHNEYVRILSYNTKMVPIEPDTGERASRIEKRLRGYDIVCLQEAFDDSIREDLEDYAAQRLGLRHRTEGPDADWFSGHFSGSGLVIMTHYKITKRAEAEFPLETAVGLDALASKGVAYARVQVDVHKVVHVFVTHTQSGSTRGRILGREAQLLQVAEFVRQHAAFDGHPVLLVGDLNVDAHIEKEYKYLMHTLQRENPRRRVRDLVDEQYSQTKKTLRSFLNNDKRELLDYAIVLDDATQAHKHDVKYDVRFFEWTTSDHAAMHIELHYGDTSAMALKK